ncbi:hypothetical protein PN478_02270 [Dolichospermum circinale CS-534/05]|uniref:hypothetical protein n=1 Tax=Dolichospermum circinale TaxID=109265 RepID=UPI00233010AD|nr:hypothetical protein [Dolichospermum circinale]MDB9489356.1 hypothetical protein [Dolichospermum circinale CS-534/05]
MSNKFNERGNHKGDNVAGNKNTIIKIIPQIPGKIFKSAVFGIILGFVVIAVSKLMGTNGEGAGIAQLLGAIIMGGYIFVTYWNKLTRMRRFVILIAIPMITCFVYPIIREMLANFILNCSTTIPQCNNTSNEAITYPLSYAIICLLFDIFIDVWSRKSENK